MKNLRILTHLIAAVVFLSACTRKAQTNFKAQRISRTASITAKGNIDLIYPLFGAFEERKVAYGWNPILIYPDTETIEEGTTFKIISDSHGHTGHGEKEYIWRVTRYDPANHLIQYLVSTPNRYWTVTVTCEAIDAEQTKATVTYTYIGLNELGNEINQKAMDAMFKHNLKDWEDGINYYLRTGRAINAPK